jgi:hypothetical protein
MKSRTRIMKGLVNFLVVLFVAAATAYAAPIRVDCNRGGSINSTLASLASAGNTRGLTIFVTGTCRENVVINAFDHLTLQASPIATLQDASNGAAPVVQIFNSYDVNLSNFTINGGSYGVRCIHSYCSLSSNIQQSSVNAGVVIGRGSQADIQSNRISNNGVRGLAVTNGSTAETVSNIISGNAGEGVLVYTGGDLTATFDTIQNNIVGLSLIGNSVVLALDLTISGNSSDGVTLDGDSTALLGQLVTGTVITGNGGHGVAINNLSLVEFDGTNNVSGNLTQPDVTCNPQYSVGEGAGTVGGTTNCPPALKDQQRHLPHAIGDELSGRR